MYVVVCVGDGVGVHPPPSYCFYQTCMRALARSLGVELPLHQLVQVRQAGSAINFLTPGPQFGGEPLQVLWLHRVFKLPLQQAVLVLGLDRFCETTINMLTLLTLVLLLGSQPRSNQHRAGPDAAPAPTSVCAPQQQRAVGGAHGARAS